MDKNILSILKQALREDAARGDVTTLFIIPKEKIVRAQIVFKQSGVVCGLFVAKEIFCLLDKNIRLKPKYKDGAKVKSGTSVALVEGKARAILTGERTVLNFLSHLSGIATQTRQFVDRVYPFKARITDTRKTIPNLRKLQKYAIKCGGGYNHRFDLAEMVMIKDNHKISMAGQRTLADLVKRARANTRKMVEVEVENLKEYYQVLSEKPDIIMLDNMRLSDIRNAAKARLANREFKKIKLEVSGNVNLKGVREIAKTGVDMISVGGLTHSVRAIDVSLEIK